MTKTIDNNKLSKILWVDLEMTGLDPVEDRILEVAALATNWDFTELAQYEAVVKVAPGLVDARMKVASAFWNANPIARNGLIKQNADGKPAKTVEDELLQFIDDNFSTDQPVILAGNSIHQDRKFIANEWPRLDERLHYRMLDVTAWKLVMENKFAESYDKPEAHRALSDIRGSIDELKYYLKYFDKK